MSPLPYDPRRGMNPSERPIRQKLGMALMEFMQGMALCDDDEVMLGVRVAEFREAVRVAEREGIEVALAWHTLGTWTSEGPERMVCFTKALACEETERDKLLSIPGAKQEWKTVHMRADCLFEIGRVHFHEGDPKLAEQFLLRALPLAQEAERLRGPADITHEDRLEGRIAELLLQLPDEEA